jgi:hypothetical protein
MKVNLKKDKVYMWMLIYKWMIEKVQRVQVILMLIFR